MESLARKIVTLLAQNSNASINELSAELNVPSSTLHQRIKRLETRGVITGYRATKAQQTPFLLQLAAENCVDGDKIRAGDAVNFSIGQGDTVVTPLKLTQMYAAIANGGTIWQMMVAKAIVKTDGTVVKSFTPKKLGTVNAAPSTLSFLRSSLREVVVSGTGAGVFAGFPIEISGKTGTGQVFGRNPNGSLKDDTSWFASYAPSKNPRYAVVMMVGQGGFGASTV